MPAGVPAAIRSPGSLAGARDRHAFACASSRARAAQARIVGLKQPQHAVRRGFDAALPQRADDRSGQLQSRDFVMKIDDVRIDDRADTRHPIVAVAKADQLHAASVSKKRVAATWQRLIRRRSLGP